MTFMVQEGAVGILLMNRPKVPHIVWRITVHATAVRNPPSIRNGNGLGSGPVNFWGSAPNPARGIMPLDPYFRLPLLCNGSRL